MQDFPSLPEPPRACGAGCDHGFLRRLSGGAVSRSHVPQVRIGHKPGRARRVSSPRPPRCGWSRHLGPEVICVSWAATPPSTLGHSSRPALMWSMPLHSRADGAEQDKAPLPSVERTGAPNPASRVRGAGRRGRSAEAERSRPCNRRAGERIREHDLPSQRPITSARVGVVVFLELGPAVFRPPLAVRHLGAIVVELPASLAVIPYWALCRVGHYAREFSEVMELQ